jgi:TonB family protein
MSPLTHFLSLIILASVLCPAVASAEDVKLREQAVQLMEIANAVTLPGMLTNYQQSVTFRVHEPDGAVKEGALTRVSVTGVGRRDESTYGDFHEIFIRAGDKVSQTRTAEVLPAEIRQVRKYLPAALGDFDQEDIIRSVVLGEAGGRSARCINFDTRFGNTMQSNQICMDAQRGTLLRWQVGDEVMENADFYQVGRIWEPAHIRRFERGILKLEIDQQMSLLVDAVDPSLFAPPPQGWNQTLDCSVHRRAIEISTPMPPRGSAGTAIIDVVVFIQITAEGTVKSAQIQSSSRLDLNDEALKTVSSWKFLPLLCNNRPTPAQGETTVHFQGR